MPLPLMIAMALAFGLNLPTEAQPLSRGELWRRLAETAGGVLLIGLIALILGELVAAHAKRRESLRPSRFAFLWGFRTVMALGLLVFAWTLMVPDWKRVVDWGLRLRGVMLVQEFAMLLPFLAGQFLAWCGAYRAEKVLRPAVAHRGLGFFLVRKARRTLGMVLPVAMIYLLGRDLLRWGFPRQWEDSGVQIAGMAAVAALIVAVSPLFVRLTWPTRRLEDGPLRDRLQRLSLRLNFRCADILVWDTEGQMVNACVTGSIPRFRYVLLTDSMIELLEDREIEAVFGHEVGHLSHHHLLYFGLFFLGSTGLMTLVNAMVERALPLRTMLATSLGETSAAVAEESFYLSLLGAYFLTIFGLLSRRFERQADVFGSRAVSCGSPACPPHPDPNAPESPMTPPMGLCPVGIRIFANTLARVAELNGMGREARSWRHGSVARRIRFLNLLEGRPDAERRFQQGVIRLRWSLGLVLALASAAAIFLSRSGSR